MKLKYNNWNEVSIDLFYKIKAASEEKRDMEVIALLCDTTEEEVGRLTVTDYNRLVGETNWISDFTFNTSSYPNTVKLGEQTLKVNLNLVEFSISQYIDFSNFYSKNELEKYYGNILATFLIPKGKKYGEDYDVLALAKEIQENLSITTANNLMFFFLVELKRSLSLTRLYLRVNWRMKKAEKEKLIKEVEILEQLLLLPGFLSSMSSHQLPFLIGTRS